MLLDLRGPLATGATRQFANGVIFVIASNRAAVCLSDSRGSGVTHDSWLNRRRSIKRFQTGDCVFNYLRTSRLTWSTVCTLGRCCPWRSSPPCTENTSSSRKWTLRIDSKTLFLNAPSLGAVMFSPTLCPRSTHLTGVQLESVSAAAGRNPLAVLAVDLGALEAGDAAARLLRHGVLGPLHEALHCWFTLTISYIHPTST